MRYQGRAIPRADQAVQEGIYVRQSRKTLGGLVSDNSFECGSEKLKRKAIIGTNQRIRYKNLFLHKTNSYNLD